MAGQPRLTQVLQPMHLVESTIRGLLYFLNSLRRRTHGPWVTIKDGESFSTSSLITFSVSSKLQGFTLLIFSTPNTSPSRTKSILCVFSPRIVYPVPGCSCEPVMPVVRLSRRIIVA